MKKLMLMITAICSIVLCASKCNETPTLTANEIVVENTISTDREAMFLKVGDNYRWYETCIKLNDWLDEECDGSFEMVVNVFQAIVDVDDHSADTYVYKFQHTTDGVNTESIHGFWVEDCPLNEEAIVVTYEDAFEKVMAVNLPKPHTHNVVLRKMVGPVDANPQWIFGNLSEQIYVDAVTGEVSDENPAFKGYGFKMPLGEWP